MRCPTGGGAVLARQKSTEGCHAPRRPAEENGRAGKLECMLRLRGGGGFNTDDIFAQMDRAARGEDIEDDDNHPDKSYGKDSGLQKAAPKRKREPPPPQEESDKDSDEVAGDDADQPVGQQATQGDMSVDTMAALLEDFAGDKPPEAFKMPQV